MYLTAAPALPDDRQLLQANAGAKAWVLLILDSSTSMNDEFSDTYRLPAYMDDFVYVENSAAVGPVSYGSKLGIAKSVLRDVIAKSATGSGINWAFSYYRNPKQALGPSNQDSNLDPIGGATKTGDASGERRPRVAVHDECVPNGGSLQRSRSPRPAIRRPVPGSAGGAVPAVRAQGDAQLLPGLGRPSSTTTRTRLLARRLRAARLSGTNRGTVIYRNTNAEDGSGNPFEVRMNVVPATTVTTAWSQAQKWGPPAVPRRRSRRPRRSRRRPRSRRPRPSPRPPRDQDHHPTKTATPTKTLTPTPVNTNTPTLSSTPARPRPSPTRRRSR